MSESDAVDADKVDRVADHLRAAEDLATEGAHPTEEWYGAQAEMLEEALE